jgi:hypothetical protein
MGKKNKAEKKAKSGKKKHQDVAVEAQDLASVLVQAARSMRTVLSRNLLESGLYAGQDGVMRRADEEDARLTKVYLTTSGRDRLQTIAAAGKTSEEIATKGLSEKQIKTLMKLLRVVDGNLQSTGAAE